ncbi:MAG: CHAT domain-containing protein [Caldilineaceae bacterium]|nr:CHAT domain-containing protein [Caldilineaceae bacterium]MBP8106498.1 CHAT domain-containing protein [Caldilineaceae bacterium]MBP9071973.1 CHAT domain-containing protein [Caldilineaceae bacterium]
MPPLPTVDYAPFELLIAELNGSGYPVTVIESPAGEGKALCKLDPDNLQDALLSLAERETDRDFLAELGDFLFDALFTGEVLELYRSSLSMVRDRGHNLRVRLRLDAPELAALPWEVLHDAADDAFLATQAETALVRYVPLRIPARPTEVVLPLRLLVIISNPTDVAALDVAQEQAIIGDALTEAAGQGHMELEILTLATVEGISQALRRFQPHIVHFIGHGIFDQGQASLVLVDEVNRAVLVDERQVRELFTGQKETRLVVLNACQTATLSATQPLAGMAPRLLQRQLSGVVAMQYPLTDKAALIFSREFYRSLALGYPVDAAISEARKGLWLADAGSSDWNAPVLHLRAKDGVLFTLATPQAAAPAVTILPPPRPIPVPVMPTFTGREAELTAYAQRLQAEGLVVVAGMPGVGKSAFAAKLAERVGGKDGIFWHTFYHGEGIQSLIWKLAGFLAWHDLPDLWQMVQGAQQSGGQLPPPNVLVDYIFQLLRGKHFLLCLDDFHLLYDNAEDDALLQQFIDRMRLFVESEPLRLMVISRSTPAFLSLVDAPLFGGMAIEDTRTLLTQRGVNLSQELFARLYARTEGNAELLLLAARALDKSPRPEQVIERLVETDDIERYLMAEVDKGLGEEDRTVMGGVAALLGYPGTRDAIEEALAGQNVRRTLTYLTNRYLLLVRSGEWDREYVQHTIVQAFYYDLLGRRERQAIHLRIAEYYEHEEQDGLRAAIHYERTGEVERAAALATQDLWGVVNRGEAQRLRGLLESFRKRDLTPMRWAQVQGSLGQLYKHGSRSQEAEGCYAEALRTLESLDDTPSTRQERATLHRLRAEMAQQSDPQAALAEVDRGLALVGDSGNEEKAALFIVRSSVLLALGDFPNALDAVQTGLDLLPEHASQLCMDGLLNLASLHSYRGDLDQSVALGEEILDMAEATHDVYRMIGILSNLAIDKFQLDRQTEAVADNRRALELVEQTGSQHRRAELEINLGYMLSEMGDLDEAERLLTSALATARENGQREFETIALTNLGGLHLQQAQFELADESLAQALALAENMGLRYLLPEIIRQQAGVALAQGDRAIGEERVRQAIALAEDLTMPDERAAAEQLLSQM